MIPLRFILQVFPFLKPISYFHPLRSVFILKLKTRSFDNNMIGTEISRWTSYLRWLQPYSPFAFLFPAQYLCHFLTGFRIGGVVR